MNTDELMTIQEVASTLRCSRGTVLAIIARGELEAIDIGHGELRRTLRVPRESLQRLIESRRIQVAEGACK